MNPSDHTKFVCSFGLRLYVPVNNFSVISLGRPEIFEKVAKIGVGCTFGSYKSPN